MKNYTLQNISIGLDVSKESISVYIPINKLDYEIKNSQEGLNKLASKLKKLYKKEHDNLVFVYEPTGSYSELLKKFCAKKSIRTFAINPKRSHNFAKATGNRNKTDVDDAKVLSEAIILAKDEEISMPVISLVAEDIKEMMSYYKFIVKQRVMACNHLESITVKDGNNYVIASLEDEIKSLKKRENDIVVNIKTIIQSDEELSDGFENIRSIIGIGELGAIVLLHLFLKYPDANKKQIISLVGLDPTRFDSGSSVHKKSKISKAGAKIYRGVLFMGTMTATRCNPEMKIFYDRLKENGKQTTQSQIAVMRKMIIIAHSLYKNKQKYSSDVYQKACGML
jgi:transposase